MGGRRRYHDSEAVGGTVAQWGKGEKTVRGCNKHFFTEWAGMSSLLATVSAGSCISDCSGVFQGKVIVLNSCYLEAISMYSLPLFCILLSCVLLYQGCRHRN